MKKKVLCSLLFTMILLFQGCNATDLSDRFTNETSNLAYDYREMYLNNDTKDLTDKALDSFNEACKIYKLYIENCENDYEKVVAAHDYIVSNCRYNKEAIDNDTLCDDDFSTYGALVKGLAVCQGYAEAFEMLMDIAGIDCIMVKGTVNNGVSHAWNMVKLENDWYHVDTTFDDPVPETEDIVKLYLNISDKDIEKDHSWNKKTTPEANSDKYDFAEMNDCKLETLMEVKDIITSSGFRNEDKVTFVWTGDEMITDQIWTNIINNTHIKNLSYTCMGPAGRKMYIISLSY